jgi:hypothetical protein
LVAGIAGSNPAQGMEVCLLCLCVMLSCADRGLSDRLITCPEESYSVSNSILLRNFNTEDDKAEVWAVVSWEKMVFPHLHLLQVTKFLFPPNVIKFLFPLHMSAVPVTCFSHINFLGLITLTISDTQYIYIYIYIILAVSCYILSHVQTFSHKDDVRHLHTSK